MYNFCIFPIIPLFKAIRGMHHVKLSELLFMTSVGLF